MAVHFFWLTKITSAATSVVDVTDETCFGCRNLPEAFYFTIIALNRKDFFVIRLFKSSDCSVKHEGQNIPDTFPIFSSG